MAVNRLITFCVSRGRRKNVLWLPASVCLSVCLSVRGRMPTLLNGPGCNLGCHLAVHYWADLQSVSGVMGGYSHLSPSGHFPRSISVSFVCTCIMLCLCRALYLAACVTCIVPVLYAVLAAQKRHVITCSTERSSPRENTACAVGFRTNRICARVLSWRIALQRTVQFDVGIRTEQSTTEFT